MKKAFFVFITLPLFFILVFTIAYQRSLQVAGLVSAAQPSVAAENEPLSIVPVRLIIPVLGIDAPVDPVALDAAGFMDVPRQNFRTGWYRIGYKPGQPGNAVIDGHYDTATGEPAVFYRLPELKSGEIIIVQDGGGTMLKYRVVSVMRYQYDEFPLEEIFGPDDKSRLNLITCYGTYNTQTNNYSERFVVFSEQIAN